MFELQFNHINTRLAKADIVGIDLPKSVLNAVPLRDNYITPQATVKDTHKSKSFMNYVRF